MITASIRRRLRNLEADFAEALMPEYPPLSSSEIAEIEQQLWGGEALSRGGCIDWRSKHRSSTGSS